MMKKSRILVTGAKGFVGTEIVRSLELKYEQIFTVENKKKSSNDKSAKKSERVFAVDITDRDAVLRLAKMGSLDAVIHSAGLAHQFGETGRDAFQKVNVKGTGNILELSRILNVKHFILISSVAVYGHSQRRVKNENEIDTFRGIGEDAVCQPEDFYGESKLDGENLARRYCEDHKIRLTIMRLATVVGEEDKGNFLKLIRSIDQRRFVWIGKGANYKSLLHREDVARACLSVLESEGTETEVFNVSTNFLTMREIVEIVSAKLKKKIPRAFIPALFVNQFFRLVHIFPIKSRLVNTGNWGKLKRLEKTVSKWLADDVYAAEKIKRKTGFEPQISAEKAVEREVVWYLAGK